MPPGNSSRWHPRYEVISGRCTDNFYGSKSISQYKTDINMSGLRPGCYIIKVTTDNEIYSVKIIKEK